MRRDTLLKLYFDVKSPFARKPIVLLHEAGSIDSVELVPVVGTPIDPGSFPTASNPLGKIPVLERQDGPGLYDSRVICKFINDHFSCSLYPEPPKLWDALTLEATADGIMDAAVLIVYEFRCRSEELRSDAWVDGQWSKIARALDALEERWIEYLDGPINIAHIAVGCALGYLDFRHESRNWRAGHGQLAAWHKDFAARQSMQATVPRL